MIKKADGDSWHYGYYQPTPEGQARHLPKPAQEQLLRRIKFQQRFHEKTTADGTAVLIAQRAKTTSQYSKKELAEIVALAAKALQQGDVDSTTIEYKGVRIDVAAYQRHGQQLLKLFVEGDEKLAAGAGGTIKDATALSSGKPLVTKVAHPGEEAALNNEIAILKQVNGLIRRHSTRLYRYLPDAFSPSKGGDIKCAVIAPDPKFVDKASGRMHTKRFAGDVGALLADPPATTPVHAIARDMILASALLNKLQVIHRDKKPGNFLYSAAGRAVLTDFGESFSLQQLPADLRQLSISMGTPQYNNPQIAARLAAAVRDNDRAAFKANMLLMENYALGVCLYELYAGASPYVNDIDVASKHDVGQGRIVAFPLADDALTRRAFLEKVPAPLQTAIGALLRGKPLDLDQLYWSTRHLS